MKSNEAPEKIYLTPHTLTDGFCNRWFEEPFKVECIEYVRKDAFIEKACVKLKKYMYDNLMFQGRLHRKEVIETFIDDFKKYL